MLTRLLNICNDASYIASLGVTVSSMENIVLSQFKVWGQQPIVANEILSFHVPIYIYGVLQLIFNYVHNF